MIEPLETRIAPATLLPGGKIVTFTDIDGDLVTVKFSKPILTDANKSTIVIFTGSFGDTGPQQLSTLDLHALGATANGVDVSVTVKRPAGGGGNGEIHFNAINASDVDLNTGVGLGIDLGNVLVQGDINYIDTGDADISTPAAKSITLLGLGQDFPGVASAIHGAVAKIVVRGAVQGHVIIRSGIATDAAQTRLGSLTIGSLVGDGLDNSGRIEGDDVGAVTVRGSILGGAGKESGAMSFDTVGKATFVGSIVGGKGDYSGNFECNSTSGVSIGGGIVGGAGLNSGSFAAAGSVSVKGNVIGGKGQSSGYINAKKSVQIGGSLIGGEGAQSGAINGEMTKVLIGGSVIGGTGNNSGGIFVTPPHSLDQLTIGGDLVGGAGDSSGQIVADGKVFTVKGSVIGRLPASGNAGEAAGFYTSKGGIDKLTIGGDFIAANIALGVDPTNNRFGDADDADSNAGLVARLGALIIKGRVGSPSTSLTYGIEANQIGSVSIGGVKLIDGVGGVNFGPGFFIDPGATVKLRAFGGI